MSPRDPIEPGDRRPPDDIASAYDDALAQRLGQSSDDTSPRPRRVRLTSAAEIKPRPVRWIWRDRIPAGELTLTPGRGGLGKSTFHAWLIAQATRGRLDGCYHGEPRACIIAATEDSWDRTIVPRLIAAGADRALVFRADVVTELGDVVSISLPTDLDDLEYQLTDLRAAVVSVDPLLGVVSERLDTHRDREVRAALQPLAALADRTGVAMLGNAHYTKAASDPLTSIMGSSAFANVARAALGFAADLDTEDGSCVISQVKNNLGRLDLPSLRYRVDEATVDTDEGPASVGRLVMCGTSERSVADILRGGPTADDAQPIDLAVDWLRDVLGDGPVASADVKKWARQAEITDRTLQRAREKLGVSVTRDDSARGRPTVWGLPDYVPPANARTPVAHNPVGPEQGRSLGTGGFVPHPERGTKPANPPAEQTALDLVDEPEHLAAERAAALAAVAPARDADPTTSSTPRLDAVRERLATLDDPTPATGATHPDRQEAVPMDTHDDPPDAHGDTRGPRPAGAARPCDGCPTRWATDISGLCDDCLAARRGGA